MLLQISFIRVSNARATSQKHVPSQYGSMETLNTCHPIHSPFFSLQLHCTILNTSYRKPTATPSNDQAPSPSSDKKRSNRSPWQSKKEGFSFNDVNRANVALSILGARPGTALNTDRRHNTELDPLFANMSLSESGPSDSGRSSGGTEKSSAVPVDLGIPLKVETIELWVMGSRAHNGEYISAGGIKLVDERGFPSKE